MARGCALAATCTAPYFWISWEIYKREGCTLCISVSQICANTKEVSAVKRAAGHFKRRTKPRSVRAESPSSLQFYGLNWKTPGISFFFFKQKVGQAKLWGFDCLKRLENQKKDVKKLWKIFPRANSAGNFSPSRPWERGCFVTTVSSHNASVKKWRPLVDFRSFEETSICKHLRLNEVNWWLSTSIPEGRRNGSVRRKICLIQWLFTHKLAL